MLKGYWVAHVEVADLEAYATTYAAAAKPVLDSYGAIVRVRAGARQVAEGDAKPRTVVIEFPSYQAALDCYNSAGYQAAKAMRDPIANSDLVIIEGFGG